MALSYSYDDARTITQDTQRLCWIPAQYQQMIDQDENGTARFFTQFKIVVQFLSVGNNMEH